MARFFFHTYLLMMDGMGWDVGKKKRREKSLYIVYCYETVNETFLLMMRVPRSLAYLCAARASQTGQFLVI